MATIYDIVQGLSQAAANAYDGALDENNEPLKAGLNREEGDPILDKRIIDGFKVRFSGNVMHLTYMSEVKLKEVHQNGFEDGVLDTMSEVVKFLKKEYRKITGSSVTLTQVEEADIRVESTSNVRSFLTAVQQFTIGGLEEEMNNETGSKAPNDYWQDFMSQGGWTGDGGKRPSNDTRKKE
jgi:hypothetical protein|tara:strand:- start:561 stop:1103 length:543 start_codon:yes stop_codon:yes gene_type:complete